MIIHNGFIQRKFHDSFKDTDLNDVDIATTKMYRGVKPMWHQLGFNSEQVDKPDNLYWWKNIIPKHYTFSKLTGITTNDVEPDDDSDIGVTKGMKTPRTSYTEIIINENTSQNWQGVNSFNTNYYYPALPKINKYGIFTDNNPSILFGGKETWDGNDETAPITNLNEVNDDLILDIDFDQTITDDLIDKTNLNKINPTQDFEVELDDNLRLKIDTTIVPDGIEKNNSKQAF